MLARQEPGPYETTISAIVDMLTLRKIHIMITLANSIVTAAQNLNVNVPFLRNYLAEQGVTFDFLKTHSVLTVYTMRHNYDQPILLPASAAPGLTLRTIHHTIQYTDDIQTAAEQLKIPASFLITHLHSLGTNFQQLKECKKAKKAKLQFPSYDDPIPIPDTDQAHFAADPLLTRLSMFSTPSFQFKQPALPRGYTRPRFTAPTS